MTEIELIIQKYIKGESSEEENRILYQWTKESAENRKRLASEKDIWDTYCSQLNQKDYSKQVEFEILSKQIGNLGKGTRISILQILKIAAVLVVAFGLGWFSQFVPMSVEKANTAIVMQQISVPNGQINQIFLADGTRIWLNSGSTLKVPYVFKDKERVVQLSGEAFFEVAKDKKHPFRVEVRGQQIEVLGTSFNVRAYDNSGKIETTLETGEIRLKTGTIQTLLHPGDQSFFDKETNQLTVKKVDPKFFSAWKDGRFEFQNEDLLEVFKVVERWYDVEVVMDESYFRGMHFSGVIKRNKDVHHFLELLNLSIPVKYQIDRDKIQIIPNRILK